MSTLCLRFIDDIFIISIGNLDSLIDFYHKFSNNHSPSNCHCNICAPAPFPYSNISSVTCNVINGQLKASTYTGSSETFIHSRSLIVLTLAIKIYIYQNYSHVEKNFRKKHVKHHVKKCLSKDASPITKCRFATVTAHPLPEAIQSVIQ